MIKIAIYSSLGLNKGRPNYRRSLQPSKTRKPAFLWVKIRFLCRICASLNLHKTSEVVVKKDRVNPPVTCMQCGRSFVDKHVLKRHVSTYLFLQSVSGIFQVLRTNTNAYPQHTLLKRTLSFLLPVAKLNNQGWKSGKIFRIMS